MKEILKEMKMSTRKAMLIDINVIEDNMRVENNRLRNNLADALEAVEVAKDLFAVIQKHFERQSEEYEELLAQCQEIEESIEY